MAWKGEYLSGTVDNSNKIFTLSQTPVDGSIFMFPHGGTFPLMQHKGPNPSIFGYTLSDTTVTLGFAPQVGQHPPWVRYWYE